MRARCMGLARAFSTGLSTSAEASSSTSTRKAQLKKRDLGMMDIKALPTYDFDDPTSLGVMRMEKIREAQDLFRKVEMDKAVLQAQQRLFKPPSGPVRVTSTIDLSNSQSLLHVKKVLEVPIKALPLRGESAVHRIKMIAGVNWTAEDCIKISEDRFPDPRLNRKSASDKLDRLILAANDPNSAIATSTPLDLRHLLARNRGRRGRRSTSPKVGGIVGFPREWLETRT